MKPSRAMTFLFCVISTFLLAGCWGTFAAKIGGTVTGLSGGTTVTLQNNGTDPINVTANGGFTFVATIAGGAAYNVTVATQPLGETCTVTNGAGTVNANSGNVSNVTVDCVANISVGGKVGGTISGLASGTTVTLQDNGTDLFIGSNNGFFVFPAALANGAPYNVTVLTQPSGKTCSVSNEVGTMANGSNVTNILVTCA
jgi:hypothetical protein